MAQERQIEYLRMLEERNRLKKKVSNREEDRLREMERGFNTNWAGANADNDRRSHEGKRRHRKTGSANAGERKKWNKGPPTFVLGTQPPTGAGINLAPEPKSSHNSARYRSPSNESIDEELIANFSYQSAEEVDDEIPEIDDDQDPSYDEEEFDPYESNDETGMNEEIMEVNDDDVGSSMVQMMQESNREDLDALRQSLAASISTFNSDKAASGRNRKKWGAPGDALPSGNSSSSKPKPKKNFWGKGVGMGSANRYKSDSSQPFQNHQQEFPPAGSGFNFGGSGERRKWGKPQESQVKLAAVRGSIKDFPSDDTPFGQRDAQGGMDPLSVPQAHEHHQEQKQNMDAEPLANNLLQAVQGLKPSQQAFLLKMLEDMENNPRPTTGSARTDILPSSQSVGDPKLWEEMRRGLAKAGAEEKSSKEAPPTKEKQLGMAQAYPSEPKADLLSSLDPKKNHMKDLPPPDSVSLSNLRREHRHRIKTPVVPQGQEGISTKALIIRINSSWGGSRTIGLGALQLFDSSDSEIPLKLSQLSLRSGLEYLPPSSALARDLKKLVDGIIGSGQEDHMWTGRLMEGAQCLELHIRLETVLINTGFSLKVHNYDTGNDSMNGVGVKDIDLYLDKLYLWSGVVSRGSKNGPLVLDIKGDKVKEKIRARRSVTFDGMPDYNRTRSTTPSLDMSKDSSRSEPNSGDLSWLTSNKPPSGRGDSAGSGKIRRSVEFSAEEMREDYKPRSRRGRRSRGSSRSRSSSNLDFEKEGEDYSGSPGYNRKGRLGSTGPLTLKEEPSTPPKKPEKKGLIVVAPATASLQQDEDLLSPLQRALKKNIEPFNKPSALARTPEEEEYKPYSSLPKKANAKDNELMESWDSLSRFGRRNRGRLGSTAAAILSHTGSSKTVNPGGKVTVTDGTNPAHPRAHRLTDSLKGERERRQQRVQQVMQQVQKIASDLKVDDNPVVGSKLDTIASAGTLENSGYMSPKNISPPVSPPIPKLPVTELDNDKAEESEDYLETPHPRTGVVEGSIPYVNEQGLMTNLIVSRSNPGRVVEPRDGSNASTPPAEYSLTRRQTEEVELPAKDPLSLTDMLNMPMTPQGIDPDIDPNSGALEGNMVEIPVLPKGSVLRFNILSTWGDPFYVGMAGMEIFDDQGQLLKVRNDQVIAQPADINVLEGYGHDPRTIDKLFDTYPHTCDDLHVWLAPFEKGEDHTITITFDAQVTLSIIRLWNYNKNRAHSYRGVRLLEITLDGNVIFKGEVKKAPGMLSGPDQCSEVILFTLDTDILARLEEKDKQSGFDHEDNTTSLAMQLKQQMEAKRPSTGDKQMYLRRASEVPNEDETYEDVMRDLGSADALDSGVRPKTAALQSQSSFGSISSFGSSMKQTGRMGSSMLMAISEKESLSDPAVADGSEVVVTESDLVPAKVINVRLLETWGDQNFFGLTGINVLVGSPPIPLPLEINSVTSYPHGLSDIGYDDDTRTLDKILTNQNQTADEGEMWLAPFTAGSDHHVRFELGNTESVYGLEVWNYNKSEEDALRGIKRIAVELDGHEVGQFLLRPAPGNGLFDFRQLIHLHRRMPIYNVPDMMESKKPGSYVSPRVRQDYETQLLPSGLLVKVMIHNNWGDHYYVGLDGLQFFDHAGNEITVRPNQVHAIPSSLKELGQEDVRVVSNLFDGTYGSEDGYHSWLAPLAQTYHATNRDVAEFSENVIYILFDYPVSLSLVRLWNYRKTESRGAREVSLWIDGNLLYRGSLRKAPPISQDYRGHPIIFTSDAIVIRKEQGEIPYCGRDEQDLLCINERQVLIRSKKMFTNPDPCAEGVTPDLSKRPETSLIHR